jgi:hypothetical protein
MNIVSAEDTAADKYRYVSKWTMFVSVSWQVYL